MTGSTTPGSDPASSPTSDATPGILTVRGIKRGLGQGLPLLGSGFVYGIAFGTLSASVGLSLFESVLMSVLVFSGTAQIAVVQVWQSQPGALAAAVIVLVANIRYLLMSASLRPWLGTLPAWKAALPLVFMVDSAYATGMRARAAGDNDAGMLVGPGIASFTGWVTATAVGYLSGRMIADPKVFGLDFVVVAFCVSAAVMMTRTSRDVWPVVAAAVAVVICERVWPGPWAIVAAGITAVIVGAIRYRAPAQDTPRDGATETSP
jgi:predicted branched-subunit amino acid permease